MAELIYHDHSSNSSALSPFDQVIGEIATKSEVRIACPYIGPKYLERILAKAQDWRVLTDVEEWLSVHAVANRERVHDLISENWDSVHHFPDLHAKVVLTEDKALVGSANLTTKGLTGRAEMSILFDESEKVEEITDWFEMLWKRSSSPEMSEVDEFLDAEPSSSSPARNRSTASISSNAPKVRASLSPDSSAQQESTEITQTDHERLVEVVSNAPSAEWINRYFSLLANLLAETGLTTDDTQLVTSLPQNGSLPVTINNRYVLTALRSDRRTGFIIQHGSEKLTEYIRESAYNGRFDPIDNENETATPHYLEFEDSPNRIADSDFKEAWFSAVTDEVGRATISPYRRHHRPVVCRAARNNRYRQRVIRAAFE
ncbi:MAG: phospholipase D family protein [Euryarchaeota archaeon]|nr:phospholipase D family protein [Euryarchaeota archaeon]